MGTRGVIIFRKDGIEKGVYNHWDSYPSGLGEDVVNMIKDVDGDKVFDLMEASSREDSDFSLSGLSEMVRKREPIYYEEYKDFILDSLMCEYAYVLDLDKKRLEFREGWQKEPDPTNYYGAEPGYIANDGTKYYPCKLEGLYPFASIRNCSTEEIVEAMEERRSFVAGNEQLSKPELIANLLGIQNEAGACISWLSSEATNSYGNLRDHLEAIEKGVKFLLKQMALEPGNGQ